MPLFVPNPEPRHVAFLEFPALMLDTSALIAFCKDPPVWHRLAAAYLLLVPTPTRFEFAFGPAAKQSESQLKLSRALAGLNDMDHLAVGHRRSAGARDLCLVNPSVIEWTSAYNRLLLLAEDDARSIKPRELMRHRFDSLVHACARNYFAPVCTANISDFQLLNKAGARIGTHDGTVPLCRPTEAVHAIDSMVACSI